MDRVIYIAMTGARELARQQAAVAHNLANVSTSGFKAELDVFRALPVQGEGAETRAFVLATTPTADFNAGALQNTGGALDVAVRGEGWLAVQGADGQEAYTRMGQLQIDRNGLLQTAAGFKVLGDNGPISIAPDQEVAIAKDGTVSTLPPGENRNAVAIAGRIKLVNPPPASLSRGEDGLFRQNDGQVAPGDAGVTLAVGSLETSNVDPAESLVKMISLARQFETQMRVLRAAEENHKAGDKILASA